jgi:hypothetical protein
MKSRIIRWEEHVECMGEERKLYKVLVRKPEGKRPLRSPSRRWRMRSEWIIGRLAAECGVDSAGSG